MHVSAMSAQMMPRVIQLYRNAGFRFVTLERAESDPAYRSDTDLSEEPRPSQWELAKRKGHRSAAAARSTAKLAGCVLEDQR